MWFLKYHSYFQFWQTEVWWHHLICSGMFFKHQFCSAHAQLARDGVVDKLLLCNPTCALLRQRSEQPMRCCPNTCVQNHDHCTKPLPHRSFLDVELQTSTLDHARLSTAALENVYSWTADAENICQTYFYQEATFPLSACHKKLSALPWDKGVLSPIPVP